MERLLLCRRDELSMIATDAFTIRISKTDDGSLELVVAPGDIVFALGANGSGKSSLLHLVFTSHAPRCRRLSAHRQTWFSTNGINLTPEQKRSTEQTIYDLDNRPPARWMDAYGDQRAAIALIDLFNADLRRARLIADAVDKGDTGNATAIAKSPSPIAVINEILSRAGIHVSLSVSGDDQLVARKSGGTPYSIAELSDGERNVLLIASSVLTAPSGSLIIVDEPERHLHRSIISPLLIDLFEHRTDCAFLISTHDSLLPADSPGARVLLVRGVTYASPSVTTWDVDLLAGDAGVDDGLRRDLLGARRKMIFVEGTDTSLDRPIYRLLFPEASVVAKAGCREVEHAVVSLRDSHSLHWLRAFGIVDGDRRPAEEIAKLKDKGIYVTPSTAIESLYYDPSIQARVAARLVAVTGGNAADRVTDACTAAIDTLVGHEDRLSRRAAEKTIRERFLKGVPGMKELALGKPVSITVDVAIEVQGERTRLDHAKATKDLRALLGGYPLRETPALDRIASTLGFKDRSQYEAAVITLLTEDPKALAEVRALFGTLAQDLSAD